MSLASVIITAVWAMLPAYLPNNVAVLAGGGPPIDGGRTWRGTRLLGDGKTWRGTGIGTIVGIVAALGLNSVRATVTPIVGFGLPMFPPVAAVTLAVGAMIGDIAASFLKRQTGRNRGEPFPVVDQLDFVAGALVATLIVTPAWFYATFTPGILVAVVVLTPVLHITTNGGAYLLGLKNEPY